MAGDDGRLLKAATLAGVVIFVTVGIQRPLWLDEAYSVLIASRGTAGIIDSLRGDNNLPGYYFLLSLWMRAFGNSEIALRTLSAIFYVAGVGIAGSLGKRLCPDGRGAWCAAFLYSCSPLAIRNAQNIRMYSLLGLLSGLSILLFLRTFADGERSRRAKIALIAVNAIGLFIHVWFGFVLAAEFLAVLLFARRQILQVGYVMAAAAAPMMLLWGRIFLQQTRNGVTDWMASLTWTIAVTAFTEFYGFVPAALLYGLAAGALILAPADRRRRFLAQNRIRLLAFVFVASLALPLMVCIVRPIYWPGRYAIIALPAIAALMGTVVVEFAPPSLVAGICILFLGLNAASQIARRDVTPDTQLPAGQSDRTSAEFLLQHAAEGDAVVFMNVAWSSPPRASLTRGVADYYFGRANASGRFVEISFPQNMDPYLGWAGARALPAHRAELDAEAAALIDRLRRIAADGHRVWLYDGYSAGANELLRTTLDAALTRRHEYPLLGPNHRRLLEYSEPQGTAAEAISDSGAAPARLF